MLINPNETVVKAALDDLIAQLRIYATEHSKYADLVEKKLQYFTRAVHLESIFKFKIPVKLNYMYPENSEIFQSYLGGI